MAFNSIYNLESFLAGCRELLAKIYDMRLGRELELIRAKSTILYPALDFSEIDKSPAVPSLEGPPVILWNHRWEHDKNPELFFETLIRLRDRGTEFKIIVVGEAFNRLPSIFERARLELADRIIQFGYAPDRSVYIKFLHQANLVVSTSFHEFYGISIIEAVRAGCRPLLPRRLSYRELFPAEFLYDDHEFEEKLTCLLAKKNLPDINGKELTRKFSWQELMGAYQQWLSL